MTDNEAIDQIFKWLKEGEAARDTGGSSPYDGQSLAHMLHAYGWVKRDIQLLAARSNERYGRDQVACGTIKPEQLVD